MVFPGKYGKSGDIPGGVLGSGAARADKGASPAAVAPARPATAASAEGKHLGARGLPVFTIALVGVLVCIFVVECLTAPRPIDGLTAFPPMVLIRDGGFMRGLVEGGQWWRLFTGPLLHGSLGHLAGNCLGLLLGGLLIERVIGWRWYAAVFALGAVAGALFSLTLNAPNMVGVGASGGIVGLFATTLFVSFRFDGAARGKLILVALRLIVPSLLVSGSAGAVKTDVAAHIGGLVGGALVGLVLLIVWPRDAKTPPYGRVALILPALFFAAALTGLTGAIGWNAYLATQLDPALPPDFEVLKQSSVELIKAYPRDPRILYARAAQLYDQDANAAAQALLESAMADKDMLALQPASEPYIAALLSRIDLDAGKRDEAKRIAAPFCSRRDATVREMFADFCP